MTHRELEFGAVAPAMIRLHGLSAHVKCDVQGCYVSHRGLLVLWLNSSPRLTVNVKGSPSRDFSTYEAAFTYLAERILDPLERLASL